ncbi:MAG: transglutaminase domain-containing protein [Chloroflexota bacterium]|nr:transglutaminase domain-containing protein [Chloroflexota bacterium]
MQRQATPARPRGWWNEYVALFLTVWMVGAVVWALGHAGWDPILRRLPIVAIPAAAMGYGFTKLWRVPVAALHTLALLGGTLVCWLVTITAPGVAAGSPRHRTVLLWRRGIEWTQAAWRGDALQDHALFLLVVGVGVFALAYLVLWWVFRTGSSVLAIGVPGIALLTTVGTTHLDQRWYLAAYLLAALPLAARFAGFRQEARWQRQWVAYPVSLRSRYLSVGSGIALVLVLLATLLPVTVHIGAIDKAWQRAQQPAQNLYADVQERFTRAVDGGGAPQVIPGFASFGPTFRLAGSLNLSDAPAVYLSSQEPHYLSANAYDFYTGLGWEDRATATFNPQGPNGAIYSPQVSVGAKQQVPRPAGGVEATQSIGCDTTFLRPRGTLLYSCGQAETLAVDARLSLSWQQLSQSGVTIPVPSNATIPAPLNDHLVRLVSGLEGLLLPGDVPTPGPNGEATAVRPDGTLIISLSPSRAQAWNPTPQELSGYVQRATQAQSQTPNAKPISRVMIVPPFANTTTASTTPRAIATAMADTDPRFAAIDAEQDRLRKQLIDTQIVVRGGKVTTLLYRGQTPNFADVTTLDAGAPIAANETIAQTARISTATADQLRAAATAYPQWLDRYRILPDGSAPSTIATPQRVKDLAAQLARGQRDPYDIATAMEHYLRATYAYATIVNNPPANRDVADYFLFDAKAGYCEYFATAMTVLLRAQSIPARVVTGYLPGARQADGRYLSRESQAHSWVEVYFPQYGWITFDPTPRPDVAPITRGSGNVPPDPTPEPAPAPAPAVATQPPAPSAAAPPQPTATLNSGRDSGFHLSPYFFLIPFTLFALWGLAAWYWFLPFRGLAPAAQWYARLQRSARWLGVPNARAATPFETAEAIGDRLPAGKPAAVTIARRYAEAQYAGRPLAPPEIEHMRGAWKEVLTHTLRVIPRRLRLGKRKPK